MILKSRPLISPKVPGNNSFIIDATSLEEGVNIKGIQLFLKYKDNPEVSPIQVPISYFSNKIKVFRKRVKAHIFRLMVNWTIEIRILNSNDDESVFSKDFTVF